LLCFALSGAAAAAGHRARAQVAESTGHIAQAAREYEDAYGEEGAPDLLYRLGLVRRKLKQYELAQEAFRGYLRAAPDGPLREEVMRQLTELGVLLEERHRQVPDEQRKRPRRTNNAPGLAPPPAQVAPQASSATASGAAQEETSADFVASPASTNSAPPTTVASATTKEPASSATDAVPAFAPHVSTPPDVQSRPNAAAAPSAAVARMQAPVAATHVGATYVGSSRSRAAPWLAASAAALAIGGATLWWHGDQASSDLDARYASGDLTAADSGRYGSARRQSIAGRAMVAGAAVLGAVAVALWW
jgi:hypothetical protein